MIIRQITTRQCVRGANRAISSRSWVRSVTTEMSPVDAIEASLGNDLKGAHSIDSQLNIRNAARALPIEAKQTAGEDRSEISHRYHTLKHIQRTTGQLGTSISEHYQPHNLLHNPPSPSEITLELLLASQAHLGHRTSSWNPGNARYIFGIRDGIHIISLDITASYLRRAAKVVSGVTERGGLVLFAGTRSGQERCVVNAAKSAGGYHLFERWVPGSITNGQQILGRCQMKIVDQFDREVPDLKDKLINHAALKPDLVVCLNPLENWILLHECGLNNIPTIGIIDTDADPTWVTYPIPANDDSLRCVQVIAGVLGKAGEEGQMKRHANALAGRPTVNADENLTRSEKP